MILAATVAAPLWAAVPAVQEAKKLVDAKKYDEAIATLEKAQKANPKAADVQKGLAEAHLAKADSFMYNDALPPRMKYPQALDRIARCCSTTKRTKRPRKASLPSKAFTSRWAVPFRSN